MRLFVNKTLTLVYNLKYAKKTFGLLLKHTVHKIYSYFRKVETHVETSRVRMVAHVEQKETRTNVNALQNTPGTTVRNVGLLFLFLLCYGDCYKRNQL